MLSDITIAPWKKLSGKVAVEVLNAPKTCGDPQNRGDWGEVNERPVNYLLANVLEFPWLNHFALIVAVMTAYQRDASTILGMLYTLHPRMKSIFKQLSLDTIDDWSPNDFFPRYMKGELFPEDSAHKRYTFWIVYNSSRNLVRQWLDTLSPEDQKIYSSFLLPGTKQVMKHLSARRQETFSHQYQSRKNGTDALLPYLPELRAEAQFRLNKVFRLHQAFYQAKLAVKDGNNDLPYEFYYDEGGDPEKDIPAQERLYFRLWDRPTFVQHHIKNYCKASVNRVKASSIRSIEEKNFQFLEFVKAERLIDDGIPKGLWFAEMFKVNAVTGTPGPNAQEWLRAHGYGKIGATTKLNPFRVEARGVLNWPRNEAPFIHKAQLVAEGSLIPVDSLFVAAMFGLLAVNLFTTTGMRMNEAMQIRLTEECLNLMEVAPPPEATEQHARHIWFLRLIPKGERQNKLHNFFIGNDTLDLFVKVGQLLEEHYHLDLKNGDTLPKVNFHRRHGRSHRFGEDYYIFQYNNRHFSSQDITACMRFLLHGLPFLVKDGKPIIISAHLLRHVFATYARWVAHLPIDIIAEILHQKDLNVTDYYATPTETVVTNKVAPFLARLATHINLQEAVIRLPAELQARHASAEKRIGTLNRVPGGTCSFHGLCPLAFACVGCPAKIPDPAQREEVEIRSQWATMQLNHAVQLGFLPEAEKLRQLIRDCNNELHEMDLIEGYRRDAKYVIHIEPK